MMVFIGMSHRGKVRTVRYFIFLWSFSLGLMGAPESSWAQWTEGPLNIVVLPFEGKGTGGLTAAEAMELELEMVSTARLVSSRGLRVKLTQLSPARRFSVDEAWAHEACSDSRAGSAVS